MKRNPSETALRVRRVMMGTPRGIMAVWNEKKRNEAARNALRKIIMMMGTPKGTMAVWDEKTKINRHE